MFEIDNDNTIHISRGHIAAFEIGTEDENGANYVFKKGDVIRFKICELANTSKVILQKDVKVEEETEIVELHLSGDETKIGDLINDPKDYWYELELNPDTKPQIILGYDRKKAKIFKLYPELGDKQ